jgi:polysaccharide pyruvyl transferase WcaK-like protein
MHAGSRASTVPKRIGLFGHFGAGNIGNEGSLEVVLGFLRRERPDAEIVCICASPDATQRSHNVRTTPITRSALPGTWGDRLNRLLLMLPRRLLDAARAFRQVLRLDAIIIPGTGILDDFGERPGGMPYALCNWLLAARLAGCKIVFISVGAGPICNPVSRRLMGFAARTAHCRSFRDELSKEFLAKLAIDTRADMVVPDVAFALPAPEPDNSVEKPLTVGLGVMNYWGWFPASGNGADLRDVYIGKLADFAERLLRKGYRVRLLMGQRSDGEAIDEVIRRVGTTRNEHADRLIFEPAATLHDLMRQMQHTDVVVTTRYHNIICALNVAKPVISLSYAAKNDALLDDVGLTGFYQHCETFDVDLLCDQLERLIAARESLGRQIAHKTRDYRRRLAEQEAHLLADWL